MASAYRLAFTASAEKELKRLPAAIVRRVVARIETLITNPRPSGCKKLAGGGMEWRIRIGDYRVIYTIDDDSAAIDITRIAHRREVYD